MMIEEVVRERLLPYAKRDVLLHSADKLMRHLRQLPADFNKPVAAAI